MSCAVSDKDPATHCNTPNDCTPCPGVDYVNMFTVCSPNDGTCATGCKGGYLNCDGNEMSNGCETQSTNEHCANCFDVCAAGQNCLKNGKDQFGEDIYKCQ